ALARALSRRLALRGLAVEAFVLGEDRRRRAARARGDVEQRGGALPRSGARTVARRVEREAASALVEPLRTRVLRVPRDARERAAWPAGLLRRDADDVRVLAPRRAVARRPQGAAAADAGAPAQHVRGLRTHRDADAARRIRGVRGALLRRFSPP